jgi:hypothetical protein
MKWDHRPMEELTGSRVVEAERTFRGLLILFEDGKRALYSFRLLREMYEMAEKLPETEPEE